MKTQNRYAIPFAVGLAVFQYADAMGQTQHKTYASPAEAERLERTNKFPTAPAAPVAQQSIRIKATVIEINQERGVDFDFFAGDVKRVKQSGGTVTVVSESAKDVMIRGLLDSNAASVISRPQIITANKRSATVQVGRQIPIQGNEEGPTTHQNIGLRLECLPTIIDSRLKLEIQCEYSTLGKDDQVHSRRLETAITLNSGDTLMLSGVGENGIVIFMTPDIFSFGPPKTAARLLRKSSAGDSTFDVPPAVVRSHFPNPSQPSHRLASRTRPPEAMGDVMKKLFPDERFDTIQIPNAVVLRGTVHKKAMPRIIQIAETYYPSVISHLETSENLAVANDQATKESTIGKQISELRGDVQSLRGEVKKLIETLKTQPASDNANLSHVPSPRYPRISDSSSTIRESWHLSLADAISIAKQNHRNESPDQMRERTKRCSQGFDQLRSLQLQFAAQRTNEPRSDLTGLLQPSALAALNALEVPPSIGTRRQLSAEQSLSFRILRAELALREQMGLETTDGRRITAMKEQL